MVARHERVLPNEGQRRAIAIGVVARQRLPRVSYGVAELTEVKQRAREQVVQLDQRPLLADGSLQKLPDKRLRLIKLAPVLVKPASQYVIRFAAPVSFKATYSIRARCSPSSACGESQPSSESDIETELAIRSASAR